jgi:hypothetical protein
MDTKDSLETGNLMMTKTIFAPKVESSIPAAYRLLRRNLKDGQVEYILQGLFTWHKGFTESGSEWRDLETQDYETAVNDVPFPNI